MHTTDHTNRSKCCIDLFTQSDLDNRLPAAMAAAAGRAPGATKKFAVFLLFPSCSVFAAARGRGGPAARVDTSFSHYSETATRLS